MSDPIIEYREEFNVTDIARKYAKRVARVIDKQTLANVEDQLAGYGYVKVMRCRDCEYQGKPHKCWLGETKPDEFCSRGKRKEGGE